MIAKQYQKSTFLNTLFSFILGICVCGVGYYPFGSAIKDYGLFFENMVYGFEFMVLVLLMTLLDNKSNLLGMKPIHLLIFPLLLLAIPEHFFSQRIILVFLIWIYFLFTYVRLQEKTNSHRPLFIMVLMITLCGIYELKYFCLLLLPLHLFLRQAFRNTKHFLAVFLPLLLTPFFVFALILFFEWGYSQTVILSNPSALLFAMAPFGITHFWLALLGFSLLGYPWGLEQRTLKTIHSFNFMLFSLISSLIMCFFKSNTYDVPWFLSLLTAAFFTGHVLLKLKKEWIRDFLILAIITTGVFLRWYS